MKRKDLIISIILLLIILTPTPAFARRGCCSWHKGVSGTCRNGKIVCNDGTTSPTCTCDGGSSSSSSSSNYRSPVSGCTNSNAINYNPNATTNDGSCIAKVYGCIDKNAYNYNAKANTDDGSCIAKVLGCIDKKANNYNNKANTPDGSCLYTKYKVKQKKIKYKTKYKYKLFAKKGKVLQKGVSGKKKVKLKLIVDEKGNTIESTKVSEEVIKKPVEKIVVTKTKKKKK